MTKTMTKQQHLAHAEEVLLEYLGEARKDNNHEAICGFATALGLVQNEIKHNSFEAELATSYRPQAVVISPTVWHDDKGDRGEEFGRYEVGIRQGNQTTYHWKLRTLDGARRFAASHADLLGIAEVVEAR
jgi:hypothetical protein